MGCKRKRKSKSQHQNHRRRGLQLTDTVIFALKIESIRVHTSIMLTKLISAKRTEKETVKAQREET